MFIKWFLSGILYGAIIYFLSSFSLNTERPNGKISASLSDSGQLAFTSVVLLANMKIFLSSHNIHAMTWFFCHCSTLVFIFFFWLINLIPGQDIYDEFKHVFKTPQTYFVIILIGCAVAGLDEGYQMYKRMREYFKNIEME